MIRQDVSAPPQEDYIYHLFRNQARRLEGKAGGEGFESESQSMLAAVLTIWLPLVLLLISLLSLVRIPRWLIGGHFFGSFITIDDLPDPHRLVKIAPPPWKQSVLLAGSALLLPPALASFSFHIVQLPSLFHPLSAAAIIPMIVWSYSLIYLSLRTITRPVYSLILLWTSLVVSEAAKISFSIEADQGPLKWIILWRVLNILLILGLVYVAGSYPILDVLPCENVAKPGASPSSEDTCPEDSTSLWQWLSFSFLDPLLQLSQQRTLKEEDVWKLSPFFQHRILFARYQRLIKEEYASKDRKLSLIRILIRSNSMDLIIGLSVELWSTVVGFVSTYAIKRILDGLSFGDRALSFKFAILHFLCNMSFAQLDLCGKWHSRRCYERTRGQLFNILHDKALRRKDMSGVVLSKPNPYDSDEADKNDQSHANIGKISNLMAGDSYQVAEQFWHSAAVVTSPLRLVISLAFLYKLLGWSAFFGAGMVGIAYLLNWPLIKFDVKFSREYSHARDKRMTIATETIQSIRFLKFMGWENKWENKVQSSRELELSLRIKQMILSAIISFIWIFVPTAVLLISFWAFTSVFHQPLTVSIAFTSISLFTQLQWALQELPNQITSWLRALVSVKRIEKFLAEEDVPAWVTSLSRGQEDEDGQQTELEPGSIRFNQASFTWPQSEESKKAETFILGPVTLDLPVGKLTIITGPTGSGKTSFLSAILGEMDCIEGSVLVDKSDGKLAYASQTAWLESATIRENIVFQSEFDQSRYDAVVAACALTQDLAIMPHGDKTEIGERGISLSGGQKARISFARAIYSRARILLMDDPLSAVDMFTAKNLVETLQGDLLRGRTVVLVTHHLGLCQPAASLLVHVKGGQVDYAGSATEFKVDPTELVDDPTTEVTKPGSQAESSSSTSRPRSPEPSKSMEPEDGCVKGDGRLIEKEKIQEGRVSGSTYLSYLNAAGWLNWALLCGLMICSRLSSVASQWALKLWGEAYPHPPLELLAIYDPTKGFPRPDVNVNPWIRLYLMIGLTTGFVILAGLAVGNFAELRASRKLFSAMLGRIVRAPTRWYDVTPTGRILNRLVSDIDTVDFALHETSVGAIRGTIAFLISFFVIILVVPTFTPFALFIAWLYIRLGPNYIKTSRDLRRLESVSRSPMFQNFSNLLFGIQSIRAYAAEDRYQNLFFSSCDTFQTMDHHYWLTNFWLMWRYDCLGSVVVFLTTSFALLSGVSEGFAAISVVQAEIFAQATRSLVSVFAQLELDFNAVERITEYLKIPQEAPSIIDSCRPPAYWPSDLSGLIVEDLVVKYADHLPAALKSISFEIKPREKVGIIGRTGSGKSTLAMSLLRILEATGGRIILDGIDISRIGLEDLRTRITIVSQDVTLFEGTVRDNLDPLHIHSDEECWEVLRSCGLASTTAIFGAHEPVSTGAAPAAKEGEESDSNPAKAPAQPTRIALKSLDMKLSEGGKSFSVGQRQMLALARAMLRSTKVIILDEATASIDFATDFLIQSTIRECMSDSMVITIAHRLFTVIDYDKLIILEEGRIVESGSPKELIQDTNSRFRKMCESSADWISLKNQLLSS
ncbi:hypothetical protein PGT21_019897 [Puccinia graminis f. sp. tritici]|uniref:P-loop containing nucleoside triphosphate hydrolase protein n=1 Tax=Puccinia graminis f. sp. tritici TaxID=56615 RepID=A0A5B0RIJ4_PUCGR|nr:hypothetical protein PGT21_019897 [Puccinia graminis f. sp. tritici]KAA1124594.1 hypothetical protein PGTUg99_019605 [Puccinia graminis f. sp. tritici]